MNSDIEKKYVNWLSKVTDEGLSTQLKQMTEAEVEDAFYKDLEFGTGGLRGVIGVGTNRMNVYTVAKASQGLADYVKKHYSREKWRIAVSYDSRINSDIFSHTAAEVFAANGISVFIYSELMPTPCLSYAVRALGCAAGIMITASHNPSKYNGYKVYGEDGCQITTNTANEILDEIEKLDIFENINRIDFNEGIETGYISYISEEVYTAYIDEVKRQSVLYGDGVDKNFEIVYSPLNGTGLKPVLRTLKESGYNNINVVAEQAQPNGNFPTCPYPNPEIKEAMELGINYAKKLNADLIISTDPDCDRVGIAVKNKTGEFVLLSGNEIGILLLDYICNQRINHDQMPKDPVMIKTIVTTDMAEKIAEEYGVCTINVLTGFKYIGEQIGILEQQGKADFYIFGFEESYGFLTGSYVRDKDGVDGTFLICEMFAYYKTKGITLLEKLEELYQKFGYCINSLYSFDYEGIEGFSRMKSIMKRFREGIKSIGPMTVMAVKDYIKGEDCLPKSDVLKFQLSDNCSVVIRPSGTEPKIKIYISANAQNEKKAKELEMEIINGLKIYL